MHFESFNLLSSPFGSNGLISPSVICSSLQSSFKAKVIDRALKYIIRDLTLLINQYSRGSYMGLGYPCEHFSEMRVYSFH